MLNSSELSVSESTERELRRQIDRSVSRALVDPEYARDLLADPTLLLEDRGCPPQHFLHLRSIRAASVTDFARQAEALFWLGRQPRFDEDQQPAITAVAI